MGSALSDETPGMPVARAARRPHGHIASLITTTGRSRRSSAMENGRRSSAARPSTPATRR